jgi:hypothetical protein
MSSPHPRGQPLLGLPSRCPRCGSPPLGNYLVGAIEAELRAEGLPADTFSALEPDSVQLAKTASRSTLGFMTETAFELGWIIADKRGLRRSLRDRLGGLIHEYSLAA